MGHTYSDNLFHIVFGTKDRRSYSPEKMERLWAYMGGIAKQNDVSAITIGGSGDHVHLLLRVPTAISVAKAVQLIKSGSSKWFNQEYRGSLFAWQQGFASFSVSRSQCSRVTTYIAGQTEHHKTRDFRQEFAAFLVKHGIEFQSAHLL